MKIRHSLFFALVAACAVSLASTAVSAVAAETPFKGTVSAVETGQTVFPIRTTTREGTGTATYLGRYTEHVTETINVLTMSSTGAATFTAANGDTLLATESDRRPGRVPPRCRLSRSTPSPAERDASPTQPAPSRWKAQWTRRRALVPARSAEPSTTRCRNARSGFKAVLSVGGPQDARHRRKFTSSL